MAILNLTGHLVEMGFDGDEVYDFMDDSIIDYVTEIMGGDFDKDEILSVGEEILDLVLFEGDDPDGNTPDGLLFSSESKYLESVIEYLKDDTNVGIDHTFTMYVFWDNEVMTYEDYKNYMEMESEHG